MLFKTFNKSLTENREKTSLTVAAVAADASLTVASTDLAPDAASSDTWSDNDYVLVGEFGEETSEIMQMSAAVTSATSLSIDRQGEAGGLKHAHPIGTPIYRLDYNQVVFSRSATNDTSGVAVLTTINIQPDDLFTRYEDISNTTGYGFVRFKHKTSAAYSSYSDGVNYETGEESSSRDPKTLYTIRSKVRQLLDEEDGKLTDQIIDDGINDKQREIAHIRLWSFYENERSLSIVANQFAYDIPSTVNKIHGIRFDTQPLVPMSKIDWDIKNWDTDQSTADPSEFSIWNNQIKIHPRPSTASSTTTLGADLSATATSATVADSSGFNRGDYYRFIVNSEVIYATLSTSTTFTGLLRGQEGTTAAAHSSGDTITERDIVYSCHTEPDDLINSQDRTSIPEPDILAYGTAIDLAPFVGKENLIQFLEGKYLRRIKDLKDKYSSKQSGKHGRIKDMYERLSTNHNNPNNYPSSINT